MESRTPARASMLRKALAEIEDEGAMRGIYYVYDLTDTTPEQRTTIHSLIRAHFASSPRYVNMVDSDGVTVDYVLVYGKRIKDGSGAFELGGDVKFCMVEEIRDSIWGLYPYTLYVFELQDLSHDTKPARPIPLTLPSAN